MGTSTRPEIRIRSLSHRFADGRTALCDLTLSIPPDECVAIVGPNGAGKTTLFLRLCGVLPGKPGEIFIGELDPAIVEHRSKLPSVVGVVFQNPDDQLFSPSVFEDVAFGPLNLGFNEVEVRARSLTALQAVGLPEHGGRVPHRLSGGEKRRAAIATVLSMRPDVWLLDEPSMFLDPRGRRELIRVMAELPGTKIIATHDLELVLNCCTRAVILEEGKLVADGAARELLANAELLERHGLEVPGSLRR
jgi:cobalt/nickel transport system ATP-binding protein